MALALRTYSSAPTEDLETTAAWEPFCRHGYPKLGGEKHTRRALSRVFRLCPVVRAGGSPVSTALLGGRVREILPSDKSTGSLQTGTIRQNATDKHSFSIMALTTSPLEEMLLLFRSFKLLLRAWLTATEIARVRWKQFPFQQENSSFVASKTSPDSQIKQNG